MAGALNDTIRRGTSIIAAVAQVPGGPSSNLSTLVPLAFLDGETAFPEDFPYNGLIFWYMSRKELVSPAAPGTIVIATLEHSVPNDLVPIGDRHVYKVEHESVREPEPSELVEVIEYYAKTISHPRQLLSVDDLIVSHQPLSRVYIATAESVYGPFIANGRSIDSTASDYAVNLRAPDEKIAVIDRTVFESISDSNLVLDLEAVISLRQGPPHKSGKVVKTSYRLIGDAGIRTLQDVDKHFVLVQTPEQVLRPLTRKYLERRKFQQAQSLFDEFVSALSSEREGLSLTQTEVIEAIQIALDRDKRVVRDLTDGLLVSGLLDSSIEERIRARTDQYIADNAAEITAKIRERNRELHAEIEALEKSRTDLQADIDAEALQSKQKLEAERHSTLQFCADERTRLEAERAELEMRRRQATSYLESVTQRYTSSRQDVLNDFLVLLPLLEKAELLEGRSRADLAGNSPKPHFRELSAPSIVSKTTSTYEPLSEQVFFERFASHVEASGFKYREIDLVAFHLNFKTSEFFVLGGVSGTGKSSLPRLYAEALAGDATEGLSRFLRIPVNPTWLEVSDLLGRVNVLDRTFNPSETGLFRQLAFAHMEYEAKRTETGMWPIVLDEMNLAQVEHYFGPFLQVFGLDESRTVSVFDPLVLDVADPLAQWSKLTLPRSVRFIGTVNFDETTRQLSLRLLDRGPLARIDIAPQSTAKSARKASGAPIVMRHFNDWVTHTDVSLAASKLLDDMNPYLRQLGCPFNPRRRNAIDRFLANAAPSICSPEQAFDLAVSQRILSLVRGLFRQTSRDAFEGLEKVIVGSQLELPECERVLADIRDRDFNLLLTN